MMSRSGYSEDGDNWQMICWRGAVEKAILGNRGQAFLADLAASMDAMPVKELIPDELESNGQYCALGVVGKTRGLDLNSIDTEDDRQLSKEFNIARSLACEIMYMNDEGSFLGQQETPAKRWERMRKWVDNNLAKDQ